jgi:hypothetical protein
MISIASSPSSVSKATEPLSPREQLGRKLLSKSTAIIATSTFFYCGQCGKVNLRDSNQCGITATLQDHSYFLSWGDKSIDWQIKEGVFRVIFYLNGKVEVVKEYDSILKCIWPNQLIRLVGKKEFHQLKKIEVTCEEEFHLKPTLDMVKDGPVILTSCKGAAFALGVKHRTDLNPPPAVFCIFFKNDQWAWHFTALDTASANAGRLHCLKDDDWTIIAQILGDTHPYLAKLPQIVDVVHDSAGNS